MITITKQEHQFEFRLRFSTEKMKKAIRFINKFFSLEEIRTIEKRKQKELHETGLDILRMI